MFFSEKSGLAGGVDLTGRLGGSLTGRLGRGFGGAFRLDPGAEGQ